MRVIAAFVLLVVSASTASAVGICFVPSEFGNNVTVDCAIPFPAAHDNAYVGYSIDSAPCEVGICTAVGENGDRDYAWSISSSSVDPHQNSGPLPLGLVTLYLWFSCSPVGGMQAAQFGLQTDDPSFVLTALTPMNGLLNAGTAEGPLLAVGGCPIEDFLAASLTLTLSPTATEPETWGRVKALYR